MYKSYSNVKFVWQRTAHTLYSFKFARLSLVHFSTGNLRFPEVRKWGQRGGQEEGVLRFVLD